MIIEDAIRQFLEEVDPEAGPKSIVDFFDKVKLSYGPNLLTDLVKHLRGPKDADEEVLQVLTLVFPPFNILGRTDELQNVADEFIRKCATQQPKHWAQLAAIISAMDSRNTKRLMSFCFSELFFASAVSHAEILQDEELKDVLENAMMAVLKDLGHADSKAVLRTLLSTANELSNFGCLRETFLNVPAPRMLMEVVKFGERRKRKNDGTFVTHPVNTELREVVMDIVVALSRYSEEAMQTYLFNFDVPLDNDSWDARLSSLFCFNPTLYLSWCESRLLKTKKGSDEWWLRVSYFSKLAWRMNKLQIFKFEPMSWLQQVNFEVQRSGPKVVHALTILSYLSAMSAEKRSLAKTIDFRFVAQNLCKASLPVRLRIAVTLIHVLKFPEEFVTDVAKSGLEELDAMISDADRAAFFEEFFKVMETLWRVRKFRDQGLLLKITNLFIEWDTKQEKDFLSLAALLSESSEDFNEFCCLFLACGKKIVEMETAAENAMPLLKKRLKKFRVPSKIDAASAVFFFASVEKVDSSNVKIAFKCLAFVAEMKCSREARILIYRRIADILQKSEKYETSFVAQFVHHWRRLKHSNLFTVLKPANVRDLRQLFALCSKTHVDEFGEFVCELLDSGVTDLKILSEVADLVTCPSIRPQVFRRVMEFATTEELVEWATRFGLQEMPGIDTLEKLKPFLLQSSENRSSAWASVVRQCYQAGLLADSEVSLLSAEDHPECRKLSLEFAIVNDAGSFSADCDVTQSLLKQMSVEDVEDALRKSLESLLRLRSVEAAEDVFEFVRVSNNTSCDALLEWVSRENLPALLELVLKILRGSATNGRLGLGSDMSAIERWLKLFSSESPLQQEFVVALLWYAVKRGDTSVAKTWIFSSLRKLYRGTLSILDQQTTRLVTKVQGNSETLVGLLKRRLWQQIDYEDSRTFARIEDKQVCKTRFPVWRTIEVAGEVLEGGSRDTKNYSTAETYDPEVFVYAVLSMLNDVESGLRPRHTVTTMFAYGFPAVAVACLSAKSDKVRFASACVIKRASEVVSQMSVAPILPKEWATFFDVISNSLASRSDSGQVLFPRVPQVWATFAAASCLTLNDPSNAVHKLVVKFCFRTTSLKLWASAPMTRLYNTRDSDPVDAVPGRKFVLDVAKHATFDWDSFEKTHIVKIFLSSFSFRSWNATETSDLMGFINRLVVNNVRRRPTLTRAVFDWGFAILLENRVGDVATTFASRFAEILWTTWTLFLHPFLAGRNFELVGESAEIELGLFADFVLCCALGASVLSSVSSDAEKELLLKLRIACHVIEQISGPEVKPLLKLGEGTWRKCFDHVFGPGKVSERTAQDLRLLVFIKEPKSWGNFGLDERCALQSALFP
ncbi:unnamed protein product [Notodromas monacha]|uniref:URB1 C-terminal domain-containing protein n=1 Tax=Notodromas monacha TaxID=399045 RepID=A0A7R9BNX6_9CRUS|nr:unnamed protein product [Notodromas monacha]CAG0919005.1 unnamed protein product [Notodromas monacha]